jgi:hypothetical protein
MKKVRIDGLPEHHQKVINRIINWARLKGIVFARVTDYMEGGMVTFYALKKRDEPSCSFTYEALDHLYKNPDVIREYMKFLDDEGWI